MEIENLQPTTQNLRSAGESPKGVLSGRAKQKQQSIVDNLTQSSDDENTDENQQLMETEIDNLEPITNALNQRQTGIYAHKFKCKCDVHTLQIKNDNILEEIVTSKEVRKRWTTQQKKIMDQYFATFIRTKKAPGKQCVETFKQTMKQKRLFEDRDWVIIKTYVYNSYRLK